MLQLKSITLKNYRSIEDLKIEFELHQKNNILSFIGQNNSGKSNILKAIHLLFLKNIPYIEALEEEDFYNHELNRTITFEAMFWEPIIHKPYSTSRIDVKIYGIRRERKIAEKGRIKGQLIWIHSCLNQSGDVAMRPSQKPKKGQVAPMEKMYEIPDEVWEQIGIIFLPTDRDLEKHLPNRKTGYLHRIIQQIDKSFHDTQKSIAIEGTPKNLSEHFKEDIKHVIEHLRINEFNSMEENLKDIVKKFFERELNIKFNDITSMACFEAMSLDFLENELIISQERIGDGARFILLMAIVFCYFRSMSQNAIFIIEEPEHLLHPHRQRVLWNFLCELSKTNYVFISTHSPEFVDLANWKNICRVYKDQCTHISKITGNYEDALIKHLRRCLDQSMKYAFFASVVILVEGESDHKAFPNYADRLKKNLDSRNITIVYGAGKNNLKILAPMFRSLEIPVVLCYDKDRNDDAKNSEIKNLFPGDSFYSWEELDQDYEDEVRKATGMDETTWKEFYNKCGSRKIDRAVNLSQNNDIPIPKKYEEAICKAWEYAEPKSFRGEF